MIPSTQSSVDQLLNRNADNSLNNTQLTNGHFNGQNSVPLWVPEEFVNDLNSYLKFCTSQQRQGLPLPKFNTPLQNDSRSTLDNNSMIHLNLDFDLTSSSSLGQSITIGDTWYTLINKFTSRLENLQNHIPGNQFQLDGGSNCDLELYTTEFVFDCSNLVLDLETTVTNLLNDCLYKQKWSYFEKDCSIGNETSNLNSNSNSVQEIEQRVEIAIQKIEQLGKLLEEAKVCLRRIQFENSSTCFPEPSFEYYCQKLHELHCQLLCNAFIVHTQPPSIIKKGDSIKPTVRFLGGSKYLDPNQPLPKVKCQIINKMTAREFHKNMYKSTTHLVLPSNTIEDSQHLLPKEKAGACKKRNISFASLTNPFLVHIGDHVVNAVPKTSRMSSSSGQANDFSDEDDITVSTEKYCLLFSCQLFIGGNYMDVWCCSRPFLFITHFNQKMMGMLTWMWYDNFRHDFFQWTPFTSPKEIPWSSLSLALAQFFQMETKTLKCLSKTNFESMREKIFRSCGENQISHQFNPLVSCKMLLAKNSPRGLTFWEWFCSIIKLFNDTKVPNMKKIWDSNYMIGFISGATAERILDGQSDGTFLIRFSDSTPSGITISYVSKSDGKPHHCCYAIWILQSKSLVERILAEPVLSKICYTFYSHEMSQDQDQFMIKDKKDAFSNLYFPSCTIQSAQIAKDGRTAVFPYVRMTQNIEDIPPVTVTMDVPNFHDRMCEDEDEILAIFQSQ